MRSAESWIGVSGFLISWAMRRATSAQAEVRCALTSSVMSSKVTTEPCASWLGALAGHAHGEIALRAADDERDLVAARRLPCFCARFSTRAELRHGLGERLADELAP